MQYQQVVSPNLNQTSDVGMCAYFVFHAFGGKNGWGFQWARQAWDGQANKHSGHPPLGISVPIWHDYWATLSGVYRNWGHVSIRLTDGRVLSSPFPTYGNGQRVFSSIGEMESVMGLGSYLGWTESMDGTRVVEEVDVRPDQRVAAFNVIRRAEPSSKSSALEPQLNAGEVGDFIGWINGESVSGNSVWFRGISGNWFWSGGFTNEGTEGLEDLNKKPLGENQRVAASNVVRRSEPSSKSSAKEPQVTTGQIVTLDGWIRGESVAGNNVWFREGSTGWLWSGGFESTSTQGLKDLNPVTTPEPDPKPEPEPTPNPKPEIKSLKTPKAGDFPKWIRYEEKIDPELDATWNEDYEKYYGVPYAPIESHIHWWGDPSSGATHDGTVSWLNSQPNLNANYVVSAGRVTLNVPLDIIALTTARRNPYGWKTENDPNLGEAGYKTLGFLHYLVEKLNPQLQGEPIRLHKEFAATSCSGLNPSKVRDYAEKFRTGVLDPETGEEAVETPPVESDKELAAEVRELVDFLKSVFQVPGGNE